MKHLSSGSREGNALSNERTHKKCNKNFENKINKNFPYRKLFLQFATVDY